MKKKRKRSSSSTSSSSSSSDRSSSGRRKSKKKNRKHRRSSRGKKHQQRVSSRDNRSVADDEEEWYPAPPNTSASFLDQKSSFVRPFEGPERTEEYSQPRSKGRNHSLSSVSTDAPDNSRGRFEDGPVDGSPQRAESSKGKGVCGEKTSDGDVNEREREGSRGQRKSQGQELQSGPQDVPSSLGKVKHRRMSSSASSEHSCKSDQYANDLPSQSHISTSRRSDSGKYGSTERGDKKGLNRGTRRSDGDYRSSTDTTRNGNGSSAEGNQKKELPTNLLDLFSQIAQFEKEKCVKPKK
ncbi:hypothetical protein J4Q44_G00204780 [Coregonus suidteri]|uniref:Uncharacterized protein n=1 Tax=Coregonus suidteri TaxID=861788 RepID=A0AAN8LE86_9TELE